MDKKNESTHVIDKMTVFKDLTKNQKKILKENSAISSYKKNEIIYKEGDKPTGLIFLAKGKVKIFKEGVGGREQIVRMAKQNGFIGFRALFAKQNYLATAQSIESSEICTIEKRCLFDILEENGKFSLGIIEFLASELGFSNTRTVTLTQKHIRGRLAESLLFLKDTYGFESDGNTLKVYLSREDLANLSNMTTSNAIRTLSSFSNEEVIALEGKKICILDKAALERISELG
ncbi:MAG: Crp/Fnr family transcriptional regulator [Bacteroidales bacterium]